MFTPKELQLIEMFRRASAQNQSSTRVMIIAALDMAKSKLYRKFGRSNLGQMFIEDFGTDPDATYTLDRVVRSALVYPDLERALRAKEITVGKATRILGSLKLENVKELVSFASTHTIAEINAFVAEKAAPGKYRESWKQVSADQYKVIAILTAKQFKRLQRVRSLEAQKSKSAKIGDALSAATKLYLWRNDPVEKAARAKARKESSAPTNKKPKSHAARAKPATEAPPARTAEEKIVRTKDSPIARTKDEFSENRAVKSTDPTADKSTDPTAEKSTNPTAEKSAERVAERSAERHAEASIARTDSRPTGRIPLTMADRHAVYLKTGGRCTFVDERGKRCTQDICIDIHHIVLVSEGGTNDISNLTHLCGPHHDLVHQLCLPLDGQVTWWRADVNLPAKPSPYCAAP